ncbi:MAG: discoidin domain-containing protein [Bacteroidales bacterium]|jgi:hypothetical protein|nr:discoidin domain-containing protein [Bacteroidales bacterium]
MKKIILLIVALIGIVSCKDQYDIYKEYTVPNGITYPGKANSAVVRSGYERVQLQWPAGSDPSVVSARISWNNRMGDTLISIPPEADTIRCVIPLPAGSYSFEIRTYDEKGNVSVPVEITGRAYGTAYVERFVNPRVVESLKTTGNGNVSITWMAVDVANGARYTEITYPSLSGSEKTVALSALDATVAIEDFKFGSGGFKHRTFYLPDSMSIDPLYSEERAVDEYFAIEKRICSVIAFSSEHPTDNNGAANVIDGIYLTNRWHTDATNPAVSGGNQYPHYVTIGLSAEVSIMRVGVWPSTRDVPAGKQIDERLPTSVKFETSTDNSVWTTVGEYTRPLATAYEEQVYNITPVPAKYCKFTGVSTTNSTPDGGYMVVGEIDFYCK